MPSDARSQCPSEETPPPTRPPSAASSSNSSGTPLRSASMDSLHANGLDKPVGEEYIPTRMIKTNPKPNAYAMQFVKTGPAQLYKSAKEQMRKAEVVKSLRKTSVMEEEEWQTKPVIQREPEDDWQSNLDKWKRTRRKRNEDILERVIEVKKNALDEEVGKSKRKTKTFNELREDTRGRKYNLVVHDDDNNDLSDLGLGSGGKGGKSSPSEQPEEGEVEAKSDAGFCTGSDTGSDGLFPDNISDTSSALGDKRESHDSLLESQNSPSHAEIKKNGLNCEKLNSINFSERMQSPARSQSVDSKTESNEYTYDKAIEDYKQFAVNSVKRMSTSSSPVYKDALEEPHKPLNGDISLPLVKNQKRVSDRFVDPRIADKDKSTPRCLKRDKSSMVKVDISKRRSMFELRDVGVEPTDAPIVESKRLNHRKSIEISETMKNKVASFECLSTDAEIKNKNSKQILKDSKFKEKLASFTDAGNTNRMVSATNRKNSTPESDNNFYRKLKNFHEMTEDRLSRVQQESVPNITEARTNSSNNTNKFSQNNTSRSLKDRVNLMESSPSNFTSNRSMSKLSASVENLDSKSLAARYPTRRVDETHKIFNMSQSQNLSFSEDQLNGEQGTREISLKGEYESTTTKRESMNATSISLKSTAPATSPSATSPNKSKKMPTSAVSESTSHQPLQLCQQRSFEASQEKPMVAGSAKNALGSVSREVGLLGEASSGVWSSNNDSGNEWTRGSVAQRVMPSSDNHDADDVTDREYGDEDIDEVIEGCSSLVTQVAVGDGGSSQGDFERKVHHPRETEKTLQGTERLVMWDGHFDECHGGVSPAIPPSVPPPPPPLDLDSDNEDVISICRAIPPFLGRVTFDPSCPVTVATRPSVRLAPEGQNDREDLERNCGLKSSSKQDLRKKMSAFLGTTPSRDEELQLKPPPDVSEILRQERASERQIIQRQAQERQQQQSSWSSVDLGLGSVPAGKYTWEDRLKADGVQETSVDEEDSGDNFEFQAKLAELELEMEKHDRHMMQRVQKPFTVDSSPESPKTDLQTNNRNCNESKTQPGYQPPSMRLNASNVYNTHDSSDTPVSSKSTKDIIESGTAAEPGKLDHVKANRNMFQEKTDPTPIPKQNQAISNATAGVLPQTISPKPYLRPEPKRSTSTEILSKTESSFVHSKKISDASRSDFSRSFDSTLHSRQPSNQTHTNHNSRETESGPQPDHRKQSLRALSAIPKPRLAESESWIKKRRPDAPPTKPAAHRDYNNHWLIQEAEQRRLEQQERITRSSDLSALNRSSHSASWSSNANKIFPTSTNGSNAYQTRGGNNANIYQNLPQHTPLSSVSSSPSGSSFSSDLRRENSNPAFGSTDSNLHQLYTQNHHSFNNNGAKITAKTYQPVPNPVTSNNSSSKPLPDAIINTITQRVQNKINGNRGRQDDDQRGDYANCEIFAGVNGSDSSPGPAGGSPGQNQYPFLHSEDQGLLSVSGKKKCSHCADELGRGAAMIIESLRLFYHIPCFKCCVCGVQLGNGTSGADVRVRNHKLHCHNCYSNDEGMKFSKV